jgi:hypothetical protein
MSFCINLKSKGEIIKRKMIEWVEFQSNARTVTILSLKAN